MKAEIIDRGRGPEIAGTRITVYDIWDYARHGDHHTYIATLLGISSAQVFAALDYIEQHKEEVLADYQEIIERPNKPYPPEVQAKVDAIKAKYDVLWADRRKKALEDDDARAIMADNDIQGHVNVLVNLLLGDTWRDIWLSLNLAVRTFADLSLSPKVADADLWFVCQKEEIVLITGNRNKTGADSLEATIQAHNSPRSLPVLTIANPKEVMRNRKYAKRIVDALLQYLLDIDNVRGTGRLWLP